jgi:hypothetical protein
VGEREKNGEEEEEKEAEEVKRQMSGLKVGRMGRLGGCN